jgi:glutamine synthetase
MPKPLVGDSGSGMHTHLSLWREGQPLFAGEGYAGLSTLALHAMGGILHHARALCAFTNPTSNSYRRLAPGYEAPVNVAYSASNRSASLRIPMYSSSPRAKRLEYRTPDPSCNPYLAFSALLMAALDGIERRLDPGPPLDKDLYALSREERAGISVMPGSLGEALAALEADHAFLLRGEVFSPELIGTWIGQKRRFEVESLDRRPHPLEFELYYDC